MMKIKAVLKQTPEYFEPKDCVVEKVITLAGREFDRFCANLSSKQDYIAEHRELMGWDNDGYHCLLVLGEDRQDGILVHSSGYDYARHAGYVPNAAEWLRVQELEQQVKTLDSIVGGLSARLSSDELYQVLHDSCGMSNAEIEKSGFDLQEHFVPDADQTQGGGVEFQS